MGLIQKMEEESDCIETIFQSYVALRSTCTIFLFFEGKMILNIIGEDYLVL